MRTADNTTPLTCGTQASEPVILNRPGRRALHRLLGGGNEHPVVYAIAEHLGLDPAKRYSLGLIRISAKRNLDKLDDQKDTGVEVYGHLPDFAALAATSIKTLVQTWLPVSYQDLNPKTKQTGVFGWVGLIGDTLFVAVADSAIEANLPADEWDVARTGQNAYTQLVIAVALAGCVRNVYAPFRSRWWRNDLWGIQLLDFIAARLPGCSLWDSNVLVALSGPERVGTVITGQVSGSVAATNQAEGFLEKSISHLKAGDQWDRSEGELPLGLARKRVPRSDGMTRKSLLVVETKHRATVEDALIHLAGGGTWEGVGAIFANRRVPMNGTRAGGRTFSQYRDTWHRTRAAERRLLKHLHWYRTGEWTVRRYTKLTQDQVRGIPLQFDEFRQRRYYDVKLTLPWRPFLNEAQWALVDQRITQLAAEKASSRKTGAAAHRHTGRGAAFKGVPAWTTGGKALHSLAAETPTAYRWRTGDKITATLRRVLMHRRCGSALLAGLREIDRPLAAVRTVVGDDPVAVAEQRVAVLDAKITDARADAGIAQDELMRARKDESPESEVEHWREKGRKARARVEELKADRLAALDELDRVRDRVTVERETAAADVTEVVLLASLLNDGETTVDPLVTTLCERYGITSNLQAAWATRPRPGHKGTVRLTATAAIPLADGGTHHLALSWVVDNTHEAPGDGALVDSIVRAWASGDSFEEIAARYPGHNAARVRKRINEKLSRAGVGRDLRRSLLNAPVNAPKAIIAAKMLGDESLARRYRAELRADMEYAYLDAGAIHVDIWCDTPHLDDYRRALDVFATGDATVIDIATLSRKASVTRSRIYKMLAAGLLDKHGRHGVSPRRCPWTPKPGAKPCGQPLTVYTPAPETGSGLICRTCGRAEGKTGVLPEQYLQRWVREGGRYAVADRPDVDRARAGERMLTVAEVAELLGISTFAVRALDREDELIPDSRDGTNSGRRYSERCVAAIPAATRDSWRERFAPHHGDGLLGTADVAAILGCRPPLIRDFVNAGLLAVAAATDGGHRRFRRQDVDALDRAGVDAYRHTPIAEAAAQCGLPPNTLRDLTDGPKPKVRCYVTLLGQRRFDLGELRADLEALDLRGSPANPIVSIGELASHPDVLLSTSQVRSLTDRLVIPAAGRVGGKRRYRLTDALHALAEARLAGHAPPPGGHLPPGRRAGGQ